MLIGLTFDLRDDYLATGFTQEQASEFDAAETIDAIEAGIRFYGHEVERIGGIKALVRALAEGRRWDLVFNLCKGVSGVARQAQVPALLEAYDVPLVFSTAEVLAATRDKAIAKLIVRAAGVLTADFAVIRNMRDLQRFDMPFPLLVKPLAEDAGKGVAETSRVGDRPSLTNKCIEILKTYRQPALVEAYLPGREFTVAIMGNGASAHSIGVAEIKLLPGGDKYVASSRNKLQGFVAFEQAGDELAREAAELAVQAWRALGCRDAGQVDIRSDVRGRPSFVEANPLPGLQPGPGALAQVAELSGYGYDSLIGMILDEATGRVK